MKQMINDWETETDLKDKTIRVFLRHLDGRKCESGVLQIIPRGIPADSKTDQPSHLHTSHCSLL